MYSGCKINHVGFFSDSAELFLTLVVKKTSQLFNDKGILFLLGDTGFNPVSFASL